MNQVAISPSYKASFKQGDDKPHLAALDGLRAIAILLVLMSHGADDFGPKLYDWAANGWCGVDLFFVLSGFLITTGLLNTKGAENYFISFYGKRFLRIFPVFYAALAITFFLLPMMFQGLPMPPPHDKPFYWLYINNWAFFMQQPQIHLVGHFWSLAVEEQFYLIWPAVVFFTTRRHLVWVSCACVVLAPLIRIVLVLNHLNGEAIYRNTFCRMDGLMAGGLCALALADRNVRHRLRPIVPYLPFVGLSVALAASLTAGHSYFRPRMLTVGLSLYVFAFACLVLGYAHPDARTRVLGWKPLRYLALWSYGIYVYHLAFVYFAHRYHWSAGAPRLFLEMGAAILFAAASYSLFESPLLKLKRHFKPRYSVAHEHTALREYVGAGDENRTRNQQLGRL